MRFKAGRPVTFVTAVLGVAVPARMADANGNAVTITRDMFGNPVSVTDATGQGLTLAWSRVPRRS